MHNALLNNHFLDVLEVHGANFGLLSDEETPDYDPAGSYALRMRKLSGEFRRQVVGAFARRIGLDHVACASSTIPKGAAEKERAATTRAMARAAKLIVGAVIGDAERRLFARIPMLLRADVASEILGWRLAREDDHPLDSLYVVVGVKRRPFETDPTGTVRGRSTGRIQKEMWLWNRLLSDAQNFDVGSAILVGLHPNRRKAIELGAIPIADTSEAVETDQGNVADKKSRQIFDTTVWKLGIVKYGDEQRPRGMEALEALSWRVKVVDEGEEWIQMEMEEALEKGEANEGNPKSPIFALAHATKDPKLRPNMKCQSMYDWPWAKAKKQIAEQLRDLTLVSGISRVGIAEAMQNGVPNDYSHHKATAKDLGVDSKITKTILEMCKPNYVGPSVVPSLIAHNRFNWRRLQGYNADRQHDFDKSSSVLPFADERTFYIDFELASPESLYSSRSKCTEPQEGDETCHCRYYNVVPSRPIQSDTTSDALIFMIGCGQVIGGEWKHRVFISDSISQKAEHALIHDWLVYMDSATPANFGKPILHVWGPEQKLLRTALRRMRRNAPEEYKAVEDIQFFKTVDILKVVELGHVAIKGNLSNSLKAVYTALEREGLLSDLKVRSKAAVVSDGADAMALALDAAEEAIRGNLSALSEAPKMADITRYNEADCREIAEIVAYLRKHH